MEENFGIRMMTIFNSIMHAACGWLQPTTAGRQHAVSSVLVSCLLLLGG